MSNCHPGQGRGYMAVVCAMVVVFTAGAVHAQSIDDLHDEDAFLRGLAEHQLPELIEHYFEQHPPEHEAAALEQQIALDRLMLRDRDRPVAERAQIISVMLDRRSRAIDEARDSQQRAALLVDQASDIYFELLGLDASAIATVFGRPSESQRERAAEGARRLYETALRAESAVNEAILDLEAQPGFLDDPALRERRREMASTQRDRRVPFLLGVGAALHAYLNLTEDDKDRSRRLDDAVRLLEQVGPRLEDVLGAQADLHRAMAHLNRGEMDRAREMFTTARHRAADPLTPFAAYLGEILLLREEGAHRTAVRTIETLEEQYRAPNELFYRLLLADQRSLIAVQRDPSSVFDPYLALLDDAPRERVAVVREAVFDRLRRIRVSEVDDRDLPPLARIALADRRGMDAAQRPNEINALRNLIERGAMDGREHELALFVLARLKQQHGDRVGAGRRWVELARRFPEAVESERAIERGAALLAEAYREQPQRVADDLREALEVLTEQFTNVPRIDHWRFAAGRLALNERRFDNASAHFASITRGARQWLDAQYMRIETMHADASAKQSPSERKARFARLIDESAEVKRAILAAQEEQDSAPRRAQLGRYLALVALYEVDAHLAFDEPSRALEILEATDDRLVERDATVTARWLQARVSTLEALDRRAEAREVLEQFIEAAPERAAAILTTMHETMDRQVDRLHAEHRPEEARDRARDDWLPLARVTEKWIDRRGEQRVPWPLRVGVADAYRFAGEYRAALERYDALLSEQPNAVSVLLGRAECLYHMSDSADDPNLAEAMRLFRRIVAGGERLGHDVYWLAQVRSLQVLERSGRNTRQIAPHIQRLRQQHPDLGGERYRREFDRLQRDHS